MCRESCPGTRSRSCTRAPPRCGALRAGATPDRLGASVTDYRVRMFQGRGTALRTTPRHSICAARAAWAGFAATGRIRPSTLGDQSDSAFRSREQDPDVGCSARRPRVGIQCGDIGARHIRKDKRWLAQCHPPAVGQDASIDSVPSEPVQQPRNGKAVLGTVRGYG